MRSIRDVKVRGNKKIELVEIDGLGKIIFKKVSSKHQCNCCASCRFMTEYVLIAENPVEGFIVFLPCALYRSCYNRSVEIIKKGFSQWEDYWRINSFPKKKTKKGG